MSFSSLQSFLLTFLALAGAGTSFAQGHASEIPNLGASWVSVWTGGKAPQVRRYFYDPRSVRSAGPHAFEYWTKRTDWTKLTFYRKERVDCKSNEWNVISEYLVTRYVTGETESKFMSDTDQDPQAITKWGGGSWAASTLVAKRKCTPSQ